MPTTIDKGAVTVAVLVDDQHGFLPSFMDSWNPLLATDLNGEQRIWRGGYLFQRCSSAGVVEGRNEATRIYLDEKQAEWLLFIDADMGYSPDALERLIAVAHPTERPIVGGLCFGYGTVSDHTDHANAAVKRAFPTIFELTTNKDGDDFGFKARWNYVANRVQPVDATGAAMLLIHRSVLVEMRDKWGDTWFDRVRHPDAKSLWGEDTSFCYKAKFGLGHDIFVHAGVKTSHSKTIYVTENTYCGDLVAQPATDEVAVIVPVLERPQNAGPFMTSLRASTGLATVYAVCNDDTDKKAWNDAGATVLHSDKIGFADKVNIAYPQTTEPWIFLAGDDVTFRAGWWDQVQRVAKSSGTKVVGTNDLANPMVIDGEHATHFAIERAYIDEHGASWDGPGVVCHDGYRHWFIDDEIITAAKARDVWAPCLASYVEHRHPLWGTAEVDETYLRGDRHRDKDQKLFEARLKQHLGLEAVN